MCTYVWQQNMSMRPLRPFSKPQLISYMPERAEQEANIKFVRIRYFILLFMYTVMLWIKIVGEMRLTEEYGLLKWKKTDRMEESSIEIRQEKLGYEIIKWMIVNYQLNTKVTNFTQNLQSTRADGKHYNFIKFR